MAFGLGRGATTPSAARVGNAAVIVLFVLVAGLGMGMLISRRSEGLRNLSRHSRFAEQAEALALSALEEVRMRFAGAANSEGSDVYKMLRSGTPDGGSMTLLAETVQAMAAAGPAWPPSSVDPVSISVTGVRRSVTQSGSELTLDWPYGFGYSCRVRLAAKARVDLAERSVA